jgi:hypothetical protein
MSILEIVVNEGLISRAVRVFPSGRIKAIS